ncbi:MAG: carboxypeptidase-like regulatory domain-containing protein [Thermoanaerobaculaceae bacterium]|nr:carboxypeptidase-like regulatory domain-containing protein [Thermoanaerobaculaceae bacterium]
MTRLTQRRIARLLAARATPAPPAGLADRIKAEIPGSIRLDRRTFRPGRRWLMPPLVEGLHPSWLAAASVLLVAGVGMVAARIIPSQPDDVWKWMALSGVVHIDDIVVTAPAPPAPEGIAVAAAQPRASRNIRIPVPAQRKVASDSRNAESANEPGRAAKAADQGLAAAAPGAVAMAATPRAEALGVRVSEGMEELPGATMTAPAAREPGARAAAAGAVGVSRPSRVEALGGSEDERNAVTVFVVDEAGRPCAGVTVTLERLGQGAFRTRTARTDSGGAATFRGVPPASYRALAAAPAVAPAQVIVRVASERAPVRAEMRVRTLPRR